MIAAGGIDVGGTKIEAKLFAKDWELLDVRRATTPKDDYDELLAAIIDQYQWLSRISKGVEIPVGIGIPGLVERSSGRAVIANLPAKGQNLQADLVEKIVSPVWFENDCRAFTLSEARLGAGKGFKTVFGLVLGTGVAGGFTKEGALVRGQNGAAGEIGHLPIPATVAGQYDLPTLTCGCGRDGCYETYISGPGLQRLARLIAGKSISPKDIASGAHSGDQTLIRTMDIWTDLVGSLLRSVLLVIDPDCIVLGGGLSNIPGIETRLTEEFPKDLLQGVTPPPVLLAADGDSSGTRGAAMAAYDASQGRQSGLRDNSSLALSAGRLT